MDRENQVVAGLGIAAVASAIIYFSFFFTPAVSQGKAPGYDEQDEE